MRGILNISINIDHFCRALTAASNGRLVNDLEAPAFSLSPLLRQLKDDILQFDSSISGVMMSVFFSPCNLFIVLVKICFCFRSGSGTSVFALRDKKNPIPFPAEEIAKRYQGLRHFKCSFIGRTDDISNWYI